MRPEAEGPNASGQPTRFGTVLGYAGLGMASGAAAILIGELLPESFQLEPVSWLLLSPGSLVPGLVFGLLVGLGLLRRGLIGRAGFVAYTAASTLSYWTAFTLAAQVLLDLFPDTHVMIGALAGLLGSLCLTGLSLPLLPFLRKAVPCLRLLAVGALFGMLLPLVTRDYGFLPVVLFFALWQGGYAALLALAFPTQRAVPAG